MGCCLPVITVVSILVMSAAILIMALGPRSLHERRDDSPEEKPGRDEPERDHGVRLAA